MSFSVRHFLRHISVDLLQAYLAWKGAPIPSTPSKLEKSSLANQLADQLMSGAHPGSDEVLADLVRLDPMASERGHIALVNAAARDPAIVERMATLGDDRERALWMLFAHPDLFREGEELLFVDHYAEGSRGRHYRTDPGRPVSRREDSVESFRTEVCRFYRHRDGSGVSCRVEFIDRAQEEAVQVSIYVQGLPHHVVEVEEGNFKRRISHPTIDAAVVYDAKDGHTVVVAKGGKPVHTALADAFAWHLLKIEPRFELMARRRFQLQSLKLPRVLEADPAMGVEAARVRKLKVVPSNSSAGVLTIEAPPSEPKIGVHELGVRWFGERNNPYSNFNVVSATISMHFHRPATAKRPKTINIELSSDTSNLRRLKDADRMVAEAHIAKWNLNEPAS